MDIWEYAQDGTVIRVTFKDAASDAQGSLKGSDWSALMPATEYFDLTDAEKAAGEYKIRLNAEGCRQGEGERYNRFGSELHRDRRIL